VHYYLYMLGLDVKHCDEFSHDRLCFTTFPALGHGLDDGGSSSVRSWEFLFTNVFRPVLGPRNSFHGSKAAGA